jgi:hypothetical protein
VLLPVSVLVLSQHFSKVCSVSRSLQRFSLVTSALLLLVPAAFLQMFVPVASGLYSPKALQVPVLAASVRGFLQLVPRQALLLAESDQCFQTAEQVLPVASARNFSKMLLAFAVESAQHFSKVMFQVLALVFGQRPSKVL